MKTCARCGKPVETGRRKYCSDACADSATRERIKTGKAFGQARVLYRVYDYRPPPAKDTSQDNGGHTAPKMTM